MTPDQAFNPVGEAMARMAEQEYQRADNTRRAGFRDVIFRPRWLAEWADKQADEIEGRADIYAWYGAALLGGSPCRCRGDGRPCDHDARESLYAVRRWQRGEFLQVYPLPGAFTVDRSGRGYWLDPEPEQVWAERAAQALAMDGVGGLVDYLDSDQPGDPAP